MHSLLAILLAAFLISCAKDDSADLEENLEDETHEWRMVTSWPRNFPALGTGANNLAGLIEEMSGGRIKVTVYGAGELVGPLEVFDAVSRGTVEMGHTSPYYWRGKSEAAQLFTSLPFGLTAQEMNAWLYYGGGLDLWQKLYAKFNLVPLAAGNSGVQMGGWFNKEINSVNDLNGLKIRMPGLGGEVLTRAGSVVVNLPGSEIFTALQSGAIDATEWVGPYNDLAFGLYKAAKYYYYPGWHEPGSTLEAMINKEVFDALPDDLQAIVRSAARTANADMLAEFTANNNRALSILLEEHGVELRRFPQDMLNELARLTDEVMEENIGDNAEFREIYESLSNFRDGVVRWHSVSELPFMEARQRAVAP